MRVRASLTCGWCGRGAEVSGLEMDETATVVQIPRTLFPVTRPHGRPTCPTCGGPIWLDQWERLLKWPVVDPAALAPGKRGRPRRSDVESTAR